MILVIFNHAFPHDSGFGRRCKMELDMLRSQDEVIVLCRASENGKTEPAHYHAPGGSIPIIRYRAHTKAIERTDSSNYISGVYEVIRNLDLLFTFATSLMITLAAHSFKNKVKIYCVNSPLTVPLFTYLVTRIYPVQLAILEFHDLEPEMAKHIKHLTDTSLVMRIEYFLERFLARRFQKIIVSSETQKKRLVKRTGVVPANIMVLPNLVPPPPEAKSPATMKKQFTLPPTSFVLVYSGNLTYDYTITGLLDLMQHLPELLKTIPSLHLLNVGDGDGLPVLESKIKELKLAQHITLTGRIPHVYDALAAADVAIIPWEKNVISATILPTKLLEYMAAGMPIIAPDFGEFPHIITTNTNGILYSNTAQLLAAITQLYQDPKLRSRLALAARTSYNTVFNASHFSQAYHQFVTQP